MVGCSLSKQFKILFRIANKKYDAKNGLKNEPETKIYDWKTKLLVTRLKQMMKLVCCTGDQGLKTREIWFETKLTLDRLSSFWLWFRESNQWTTFGLFELLKLTAEEPLNRWKPKPCSLRLYVRLLQKESFSHNVRDFCCVKKC